MSRLTLGRIAFDVIGFDAAVERVVELGRTGKGAVVVTPNSDHVVRAEHDAAFVRVCADAALVVADGMPIVWASRLLGQPLPCRIAGSDLAPAVCGRAADEGLGVFLLGGLEGEAELAARELVRRFPGLVVAGTWFPPFGFEKDEAECRRIVQAINDSGARIVLVGVGSPKQELWIARWRGELRCGVLLGVGITIAFLAGTARRAPRFMQRAGLEWLFRMAQEPRRLVRRYVGDLAILAVVWRAWRLRKN